MHELAIADSVVRIACAHARGRRVAKVELKVGHLRQVVPSALEFAFELVACDTVLEGAELALVEVPAAGRCRACGAEGRLDGFPFTCRACGGWDIALTAGEELRVESLDLETKEEIAYGR